MGTGRAGVTGMKEIKGMGGKKSPNPMNRVGRKGNKDPRMERICITITSNGGLNGF
jgi:hypothetical protein